MNCIVLFLYIYKNDFVLYLSTINLQVSRYKIYYAEYQKCIDILLKFDSIDEFIKGVDFESLFSLHLGDFNSSENNNSANQNTNNSLITSNNQINGFN